MYTLYILRCFLLQAPMYYRKANAAMLMYDITSSDSFYDIKDWVKGQFGNLQLCHAEDKITNIYQIRT